VALAGVVGCNSERQSLDPELPPLPPLNPELRAAAFILDVDARRGVVKVTEPSGIAGTPQLSVAGPDFSLLGGDAIDLLFRNFNFGQFDDVTGTRLVTWEMQLSNQLGGVNFIAPTWPEPPSNATGIHAIPLRVVVTEVAGSITPGGQGNEIIIELPSLPDEVSASEHWNGSLEVGGTHDGAPYNWFNDTACPSDNDCFRFETYGAPLFARTNSAWQTVGIRSGPDANTFRVFVILAADIQDAQGVPTEAVCGRVSSAGIGQQASIPADGGVAEDALCDGAFAGTVAGDAGVPGVTVSVGDDQGVTDAFGYYSFTTEIGNINITVDQSTLPSNCTLTANTSNIQLSDGTPSSGNDFEPSCTPPVSPVSGTIVGQNPDLSQVDVAGAILFARNGLGTEGANSAGASGGTPPVRDYTVQAPAQTGDLAGVLVVVESSLPPTCRLGATLEFPYDLDLNDDGTVDNAAGPSIVVPCDPTAGAPEARYELIVAFVDSDPSDSRLTAVIYQDMCDPNSEDAVPGFAAESDVNPAGIDQAAEVTRATDSNCGGGAEDELDGDLNDANLGDGTNDVSGSERDNLLTGTFDLVLSGNLAVFSAGPFDPAPIRGGPRFNSVSTNPASPGGATGTIRVLSQNSGGAAAAGIIELARVDLSITGAGDVTVTADVNQAGTQLAGVDLGGNGYNAVRTNTACRSWSRSTGGVVTIGPSTLCTTAPASATIER
jgi:hypothetical protein